MGESNLLLGMFSVFADFSMIVGPCAGYMVQIRKMRKDKISEGFSTYVSFILILSNLIRLFWWYLEKFSLVILNAAILMILCQVVLLYNWVAINKLPPDQKNLNKQSSIKMTDFTQVADKSNEEIGSSRLSTEGLTNSADEEIKIDSSERPKEPLVPAEQKQELKMMQMYENDKTTGKIGLKLSSGNIVSVPAPVKDQIDILEKFIDTSAVLNTNAFNSTKIQEEGDKFVESFWYWNHFRSYLMTLFAITTMLSVLTYVLQDQERFIALMGTLSSLIEAMLGVPQFYLNYTRKNTQGLAPLLIGMWLFGDGYKLMYYYSYNSPMQLILCSVFQLCTDCSILAQFYIYKIEKEETIVNFQPPQLTMDDLEKK